MKNKRTLWECMDCGFNETNHKHWDGLRCPKCGSAFFVSHRLNERIAIRPIKTDLTVGALK